MSRIFMMPRALTLSFILLGIFIPGCKRKSSNNSDASEFSNNAAGLNAPHTRFNNPLANGVEEADPSIVSTAFGFYRVKSGGPGVIMNRSLDLKGFSRDVLGVDRKDVVELPQNVCAGVWAPELQLVDNNWYIYFAAIDATLPGGCAREVNRRMYVAKGDNINPWKANFKQIQQVDTDGGWAIDGVAFKQPKTGNLYFVYAGSLGQDGESWSSIFIKRMKSPMETSGQRADIGENFPIREYEKDSTGWGVREGPEVLIQGNKINIVYSAAGSWDATYCLSNFYASVDADPMDPNSWTLKDANRGLPMNGCQFDRNVGAGHNCFFKSPDQKETWMTYHRYRDNCKGWQCRQIHAKRISFNLDSTPALGTHVPGDTEPSGVPVP